MAENNIQENATYAVSSVEERGRNEKADIFEIKEIDLETNENRTKKQKLGLKEAKCSSINCMLSVTGKFALYLCYLCDIFLCEKCLLVHNEKHEFVKVDSERSEREKMAKMFVREMRNERTRESKLRTEDIRLYGRKNVKHDFDKEDCRISSLCGLQNKKWVLLDFHNSSMKILSTVTNTLLRYVRFESLPWGATEIEIKTISKDPDLASDTKHRFAKATKNKPVICCLLAVTIPYKKQIWFIDVSKTPAIKTNVVQIARDCWEIDYSEDRIYVLCKERTESGSPYSVDILTSEGNLLTVIQNNPDIMTSYIPDIAVYKGKVCLSDNSNDRILCLNEDDGKTDFKLTKEEVRGPLGIDVDLENNVYVCGRDQNNVYRFHPDVCELTALNLDKVLTLKPDRICLIDGKLFIGHFWNSSLRNFVTIVQLT